MGPGGIVSASITILLTLGAAITLASWRLSTIGGPSASRKHGAGFLPHIMPEPEPKWISLSSQVATVRGTRVFEAFDSSTLDSYSVQEWLTRQASCLLARAAEQETKHCVGVDIDYSHENAKFLTLLSDAKTRAFLARPRTIDSTDVNTPLAIAFTGPQHNTPHIFAIRLRKWCPTGRVILVGFRVNYLIVDSDFAADVDIFDSWINTLRIHTKKSAREPRILITNTRIDKLCLQSHCCSDLFLTDVYVRDIDCVPPGYGNPFVGALVLSGDVELGTKDLGEVSIQHFRNLRHNLLELRNFSAAYVIRAAELLAERKNYRSNLICAINYLYEFSSGFGNRPERTLSLLLLLVVYNLLLVWTNGLYSIEVDCMAKPSAWLATLCGGDGWSRFEASFLVTFQDLFAPARVLSENQPVMSGNLWIAIWLWLSNLGVIGLLALAAVGIRRRMRE